MLLAGSIFAAYGSRFKGKCLSRCIPLNELSLTGRLFSSSDPEQSLKCRHWRLPPVESEDKFVQVGLQIFGLNPVMGSLDPGFQVRKEPVDV